MVLKAKLKLEIAVQDLDTARQVARKLREMGGALTPAEAPLATSQALWQLASAIEDAVARWKPEDES